METIYNYVESVFVNLPRTKEMQHLKEEMLHNMEEKYLDLKASGVSENEAIGTVLSEFGNIDEIIEEYNLSLEEESEADPDEIFLNREEVEGYLLHRHQFAFSIALGVFLCIISVAVFFSFLSIARFFFPSFEEGAGILGVIGLLLCVAAGVFLFIIYGMRESQYPFANRLLKLDPPVYARVKEESRPFKARFPYAIATGVVLCILGPISLLLSVFLLGEDNPLSIVFLMGFIATGVFLFVYYGIQNDTYDKLLSIGSHTRSQVKANKLTETVSSIVFPLATLFYLFMGFVHGAWGTAWIIFPIVGIGFGIFAAIAEGIAKSRERKW